MPYSLSLSLCVWGDAQQKKQNREKTRACNQPASQATHTTTIRYTGHVVFVYLLSGGENGLQLGERERECMRTWFLLPHTVCVYFFGENKNKNINMAYYEHK